MKIFALFFAMLLCAPQVFAASCDESQQTLADFVRATPKTCQTVKDCDIFYADACSPPIVVAKTWAKTLEMQQQLAVLQATARRDCHQEFAQRGNCPQPALQGTLVCRDALCSADQPVSK